MKDVDPGEIEAGGFNCAYCEAFVVFSEHMGTQNRNHCNYCLYSKHLDDVKSGDRASACGGLMRPASITLKHEGVDKYGRERFGDVMLVHICDMCSYVRANRIAADDPSEKIMEVFDISHNLSDEIQKKIHVQNIVLLRKEKEPLLTQRLFGKTINSYRK